MAAVGMDLGCGWGHELLSQHIGWSGRAATRPKTEDDGALLLLLLLQPLVEGASYLNPHRQSLLAVLHASVGL